MALVLAQISPAVRFGRSDSYRARALPPRLFPATLLALLQPTYLPILGADEKLLAATVTSERSHLLEAYRCLTATLFYRHRPHSFDFRSVGNSYGKQPPFHW
jgi:hypothetical protein